MFSSCCPICFDVHQHQQRFTSKSEDLLKNQNLHRRFFHFLQRYVDNNANDGEGVRGSDLTNFPVELELELQTCVKCFELMELFCQLYHQFQTIQLKLNWTVERLTKVMKCSEEINMKRIIKPNKKLNKNCNNNKYTDDDNFFKSRKNLIKKCSEKVRRALPQLSIKRFEFVKGKESESEEVAFSNANNVTIDNDRDHFNDDNDADDDVDNEEIQAVGVDTKIEFSSPKKETFVKNEDHQMTNESVSDLDHNDQNEELSKHWSSTSSSSSSDIDLDPDEDDARIGQKSKIRNLKTPKRTDRKRKKVRNGKEKKLKKAMRTPSNFRLKCPQCSDWFDGVRKLLVHRKDSESCGGAAPEPPTGLKVDVLLKGPDNPESEEKIVVEIPWEIYICETCDISFYSSEDLDDHSKLHGNFTCNFCDFEETYAPNMSKHEGRCHQPNQVKRHHPTNKFCSRCDLEFTEFDLRAGKYLKHHLEDHLNLKLNLPQCPICKTTKPGKFDIGEHFKIHHDLSNVMVPEDMKVCKVDNCGAYFVSRGSGCYVGLKDHLYYRHGIGEMFRMKRKVPQTSTSTKTVPVPVKKTFSCRDCNKVFHERRDLKGHRLRYHIPLEKLIHCTVPKCKKTFESNMELQRHMGRSKKFHESLANPEKKGVLIPCPVCGKMIRGDNQGYYKSHMKTHEEGHQRRSYVCDICGKSFKEKFFLRQHLFHHSRGEKSEEFYKLKCGECGKKFFLKQKLDQHVRAKHTKEKPFVCDICGEAYFSKQSLVRHIKLKHTKGGGPIKEMASTTSTTIRTKKQGRKVASSDLESD